MVAGLYILLSVMSVKPTNTSQASEGAATLGAPSSPFQFTGRPIIPLRTPTRTPTKGKNLSGPTNAPLWDPTRTPSKKHKPKGLFQHASPTKVSDHLSNFTPNSSAAHRNRPNKHVQGVRFNVTDLEYDSLAALLRKAVGTSGDPYGWDKPTPEPQSDAFETQEFLPEEEDDSPVESDAPKLSEVRYPFWLVMSLTHVRRAVEEWKTSAPTFPLFTRF